MQERCLDDKTQRSDGGPLCRLHAHTVSDGREVTGDQLDVCTRRQISILDSTLEPLCQVELTLGSPGREDILHCLPGGAHRQSSAHTQASSGPALLSTGTYGTGEKGDGDLVSGGRVYRVPHICARALFISVQNFEEELFLVAERGVHALSRDSHGLRQHGEAGTFIAVLPERRQGALQGVLQVEGTRPPWFRLLHDSERSTSAPIDALMVECLFRTDRCRIGREGTMKRLEGRTAVITGGGTNGIGRAAAARLVEEGAHVFIMGRRERELDDAAASIGREVTTIQGDITRSSDLDRLFEAVDARGNGLDILFANAGVATFASIDDLTVDDLNHVFGINVVGTMLTVQKAIPLLKTGSSVIVNVSTSADRGAANMGAYAASKAALRSFTRTWANELKDRGIRVNAISPGPTDTSGVVELVGAENVAAYNEGLAAVLPIGRTARLEEMAGVIAFLASDDSSFMLGANVLVDGGVNQI